MVTEVEDSVEQLTDGATATDGGRPLQTGEVSPDDVSLPDDLPDGIPDVVVDQLADEQLRQIARGDLEPTEAM